MTAVDLVLAVPLGIVLVAMLGLLLSCFWQRDFPKRVYPIQASLFVIVWTALLFFVGAFMAFGVMGVFS